MRESELFGLTWDKVDFAKKTVNVFEQCGPVDDTGTLGQVELKTAASRRTLSLDPLTIRALEMQKGKDERFVFPSRTGGYILKRTMAALWFPRLLEAGGLPNDGRIWFHVLRGAAASLLTTEDVATPKIDKWLGHVTPGIAGRYITVQDADLVKVAATMRGILAPVWADGGKSVVKVKPSRAVRGDKSVKQGIFSLGRPEARMPSKQESRVRFPPPAPDSTAPRNRSFSCRFAAHPARCKGVRSR